jgi:hypothetical protein
MQWKNKALDRIRFDNIRRKRSVVEKHVLHGYLKMLRCQARKKRTARRIWIYVEQCVLRRNSLNERFLNGHKDT